MTAPARDTGIRQAADVEVPAVRVRARFGERRPRLAGAAAAIGLLALAALALSVGRADAGPGDWLAMIAAELGLGSEAPSARSAVVLWQVRLPRVLAALVIGASLAGAGSAYQALFRNPLVSPDILGVSAGAGLGATAAIFFALPVWAIQACAFLGGLAAVAVVYLVAGAVREREPALVLVLAGVAVGTLLAAGISLLKLLADPYTQLPTMTYWLLGSLTAITRGDMAAALPAIAVGLAPLLLLRWRLTVMSLGDGEARALGLQVGRLRALFVAGATLVTAASVSLAGIVGWIGLVTPHVARLLVGPDMSRLLPWSLALGGGFLLAVDTVARTAAPVEIPLGILTAIVGAPFFLFLLAKGGRTL